MLPFGAPRPPKNAPKTHPRRNLDFSSIWDRFGEPLWSYFHDFGINFGIISQPFYIKWLYLSASILSHIFMNLTSSKVDKTDRQLDQCSRQQLQLDTGNKIHKRSRQRGHTYSASILLYNETNVPSLICPF